MKKFSKYTILGLILGLFFGLVIASYLKLVTIAEKLREEHLWLILFLPVVGIIFLQAYAKCQLDNREVILPLNTKKSLKRLLVTSLGTIFSHLVGASIGRENTAARLAEDLSEIIVQKWQLSAKLLEQIYLVAMAAGLAGTFGVPLAAIVLIFEVIPRQKWQLRTIYLTILVSFITVGLGKLLNVKYPDFHLVKVNSFTWQIAIICLLAVFFSALLGVLFRYSIKWWQEAYKVFQINEKTWLVLSSVIVFLLIISLKSVAYLGVSSPLQVAAVVGNVSILAFVWKWLFTMLCVGAGFQGGILTPAIDISLCAGASLAILCQGNPKFIAALMLAGVLTVLSRAPLASTLMVGSFFGYQNILYYFLITLAVNLLVKVATIFKPKEIKGLV